METIATAEKERKFGYWIDGFSQKPEKLRKRLANRLVLASAQAEPREIALLSLVKACDFLDLVFVRDEYKLASRRIYELVVDEALKNPALQTIEAIGAAIEAVVEED